MTITKQNQAEEGAFDLPAMVQAFHARHPIRVWSVILTIFGDIVAPRGGVVSAKLLSAICGRLGLTPAALRTALSRLAKEGWILREMLGRNSFYRLSPPGTERIVDATLRIYSAEAPQLSAKSYLLIGPEEGGAPLRPPHESEVLQLLPSVYLSSNQRDASGALSHEYLVLDAKVCAVPAWLKTKLGPAKVAEDYRFFLKMWSPHEESLGQSEAIEPLEACAARTLLIHEWRRILLRHQDLPKEFLPDDWPGETARTLTHNINHFLNAYSNPWLDETLPKLSKDVGA